MKKLLVFAVFVVLLGCNNNAEGETDISIDSGIGTDNNITDTNNMHQGEIMPIDSGAGMSTESGNLNTDTNTNKNIKGKATNYNTSIKTSKD